MSTTIKYAFTVVEDLLVSIDLLRSTYSLRKLKVSMGMTAGSVFTASIGSSQKNEYNIFGEAITLARDIQFHGQHKGYSLTIDELIFKSPVLNRLDFIEDKINFSNKNDTISIYYLIN